MAIAIERTDHAAGELRRLACRASDPAQARRMLAIALVMEGSDRTSAARSCGMDRQTLRDWVHRYNAEGIAGLVDRPRPGRPPQLSPAQVEDLVAVRRGRAGHRGGRGGALALRRSQGRGRGPLRGGAVGAPGRADPEPTGLHPAEAAAATPEGGRSRPGGVQKNFTASIAEALPEAAEGKPLEIWFQDEARVGQQGTTTRVWARRGTRPRAVRDTRYEWAYLFGAVCPQRGTGAGLVLPRADTEAMTLHLAEIAAMVTPGAHAVLVLDGAGWHRGGDLVVPPNLTLLKLPPYAPELNPAENIWEYLRKKKLANRLYED